MGNVVGVEENPENGNISCMIEEENFHAKCKEQMVEWLWKEEPQLTRIS